MGALQELFDLLLTPPGDLYYHLTLLFMLQIFLATAWGHWSRAGRSRQAGQVLWAAAGLLLTRIALILAAAIAGSGVAAASAILPPLERFMDLCLIPLTAWAFLPLLRQHPRLGIGVLGGVLIPATLLYALSAVVWFSTTTVAVPYDAGSQIQIWAGASVLLASAALLALMIWSRPGTGLLAAAFSAWLVGHLASLLAANLAGATRLANLIAIPLATALVFQEALQQYTTPPPPPPPPAVAPPGSETQLLELVRQVEQSQDEDTALTAILPALVQHLGMGMAAVGLPAAGATPSVRIAALYPATRPSLPTLTLESQPTLAAAIQTHRAKRAEAAEAAALLQRLGVKTPTPLLIEPLAHGDDVMAVLMLAPPASKLRLAETTVEQVHALAGALSGALANVRQRRAAERKAEQLTMALRERDTEQSGSSATLQTDLEQVRQEAQTFARRVTELEGEAIRQQRRADELAELLHFREEQARELTGASTQVAAYEKEIRTLTASREAIQNELTRLTDERGATRGELETWKQRVQQMEQQCSQLEQALQAAQAVQQRKVSPPGEPVRQDQGEVVASMANELRTPLTSIVGYTDLLLGDSANALDGETQRKFIQRIKANVERLRSLVNDLVALTTIDAGIVKLSPTPVNVTAVVNEAVGHLASQFREREVTVRVEGASGLPIVQVDRDSLYQIILHLLVNACQCSRSGTEVVVSGHVQETEEKGLPPYLRISVADTGGGIAPEDQARVFQRFYRADHPLISGLGETGVGMAIAKSLADANKGKIWVESEMGVGSTFSFILMAADLVQPKEQA